MQAAHRPLADHDLQQSPHCVFMGYSMLRADYE
jgi:hypothetical protein